MNICERKISSVTLIIALCLPLLLLLFGCAKKVAEPTIKVGLISVQTGPDGQIGKSMLQGAQLAIDEWNARGGVLGKKVEAIWRDDEAKPDKAVTAAQDLVNSKVVAVFGHFNSGCTLPASRIYSDNHILHLTISNNSKITEQGFKTLFRIAGKDIQQADVTTEFITQNLKLKKLAILHDKTAFGENLAQTLKIVFETAKGTVPLFAGVNKSELDFRANITQLKESGAEVLYWAGIYGQAGPLVVQMRQAGLNIPVISCSATVHQNLLDTLGSHSSDYYVTNGPDYEKLDSARDFIESFRKKFGHECAFSVSAYDAINVMFKAMEKAKSFEAEKVAAVMRSETFSTCFGPIAFDAKGDLTRNNYIMWTVKDGKFIPIEQPPK